MQKSSPSLRVQGHLDALLCMINSLYSPLSDYTCTIVAGSIILIRSISIFLDVYLRIRFVAMHFKMVEADALLLISFAFGL